MSGPSRSTLTGRIFDVVVDHFADQLLDMGDDKVFDAVHDSEITASCDDIAGELLRLRAAFEVTPVEGSGGTR